jgi:hypothetical protein
MLTFFGLMQSIACKGISQVLTVLMERKLVPADSMEREGRLTLFDGESSVDPKETRSNGYPSTEFSGFRFTVSTW